MSRKPQRQRCAHAGCRAWALHGGPLCSIHSGRTRVGARHEKVPQGNPAPAEESVLPSLEAEIALLAARRDEVDRFVQERLAKEKCTVAEALRYLAILCEAGKSLAAMLARRDAAAGADEIEGFFEAVAVRVHELAPASDDQATPDGMDQSEKMHDAH